MLSLGDIERSPERIGELSPDEIATLAGRLASLQASLMIRRSRDLPPFRTGY